MPVASVQDAQQFLAQNPDIDLFELFILDANGVPRGKLLHRDELLAVYASGRPLPSTILGLSINGDEVEDTGLIWAIGDIDCRAYPLAGSLTRMPWSSPPGRVKRWATSFSRCTWRSSAPSTASSWPRSASRTGAGT